MTKRDQDSGTVHVRDGGGLHVPPLAIPPSDQPPPVSLHGIFERLLVCRRTVEIILGGRRKTTEAWLIVDPLSERAVLIRTHKEEARDAS